MIQVGDIVRYLNTTGGGRVVRVDGNMAYVDEDGFETPVLVRECVVVTPAAGAAPGKSKYVDPVKAGGFYGKSAPKASEPTPAPKTAVPELDTMPKVPAAPETREGELLNVVLAYEPREIKHLTTTTYDAYLVNDSNYYLYFTYLTRADEAGWMTRFAGIVEPSTQVHLGEIAREDLTSMDRVAVQYIAFKRDKEFALKAPVAVENRLDTTKFFKLHCFHDSIYFDSPVIEIPIVKDDIPQRPMVIDSGELERAMRLKRDADKPSRRPVEKHPKRPGIVEVDLHINELLDSSAGLSNSDMLEVQLREFRRVMDENKGHKGQKIVFIHGKGEGVLRAALLKELRKSWPQCDVQDASFREYGFGATQVTIR
ncbi:MAG: DUF2027 domain-containing protein [Pseudoflavonifractor sp.]|nr:DUF2027 domain-containing protein [Pseudoflavonifractor sp.]